MGDRAAPRRGDFVYLTKAGEALVQQPQCHQQPNPQVAFATRWNQGQPCRLQCDVSRVRRGTWGVVVAVQTETTKPGAKQTVGGLDGNLATTAASAFGNPYANVNSNKAYGEPIEATSDNPLLHIIWQTGYYCSLRWQAATASSGSGASVNHVNVAHSEADVILERMRGAQASTHLDGGLLFVNVRPGGGAALGGCARPGPMVWLTLHVLLVGWPGA